MFIRQALTAAICVFLFAGCALMSAINAEVSRDRVSSEENWNGILGIFNKAGEDARNDLPGAPVQAPKPAEKKIQQPSLTPVTSRTKPKAEVPKSVTVPPEKQADQKLTGYFDLEIIWGKGGSIKNLSPFPVRVAVYFNHAGKLMKLKTWLYDFGSGSVLSPVYLGLTAEVHVFSLATTVDKIESDTAMPQKSPYKNPNK